MVRGRGKRVRFDRKARGRNRCPNCGSVLVDVLDSAHVCVYDGLPCCRFIGGQGFGACYVRGLEGELHSVCSRFVLKSGVPLSEDLVRKELIPK